MKRISYIVLLFTLGFLFSCAKETNDIILDNDATPDPGTQLSYIVPLDDAVAELEQVLNARSSDGAATRAIATDRVIGNIEIVGQSSNSSMTRSANMDSLLYIVNFEDSKGYAILGADKRADGVIAIVDKGNITADEFLFSQNTTADNGSQYLYNTILEYVSYQISTYKEEPVTRAANQQWWGSWVFTEGTLKFLTTEWHQREPYNYYCPEINGQKCVAGCVAIAVAQILAYNKKVHNIGKDGLSGYTFDWNGILADMENPGTNPLAVATLIRAVGASAQINYGLDESSTTASKACTPFIMGGYAIAVPAPYNFPQIKSKVCDNGLPVFVGAQGVYPNGTFFGGHAWVIDGYEKQLRYLFEGLGPAYIDNKVIGNETRELIHCNYGWRNGDCNGWYVSNIFNFEASTAKPDHPGSTSALASWNDPQIIMYL